MTDTPPVESDLASRLDRLWRSLLPIVGGVVGITMIFNEVLLKPKADYTIIGIGAIIAGFGPVGVAEFLKGRGGPS